MSSRENPPRPRRAVDEGSEKEVRKRSQEEKSGREVRKRSQEEISCIWKGGQAEKWCISE